MPSEDAELNSIMSSGGFSGGGPKSAKRASRGVSPSDDSDQGDKKSEFGSFEQWTTSDGKRFLPASQTCDKLTPGFYEIQTSQSLGLYFERLVVTTGGLLRFPQTNSNDVVEEIQRFWEREELFHDFNLSYKRGIILWGPPGCHAAGTRVVMYDGNLKNVEDVRVGDRLIGPDSQPRDVLALCRGVDEMFRITPTKGAAFVVNAHHVLSLTRSQADNKRYPTVMNTTVKEYLGMTKCSQRSFKLRRTGVDFPSSDQHLPIEPYFLGVWLGDGTEGNTQVTTADPEIEAYLREYAARLGLTITAHRKTDSICSSYTLVGTGTKGGNCLRTAMNDLGILGNKVIPDSYLRASRQARLELLAGLVDTDGGYGTSPWRPSQKFKKKGWKGSYTVVQKRVELAHQIVRLAQSLGLGATIRLIRKGIKKYGFEGEYMSIGIYGNIEEVPVCLPRKKAIQGFPNKDPLRTGFRSIEPLGEGQYYGFTLSGDHLYLTSDFTIHHNSGKSSTIKLINEDVVERGGIVVKFTAPGTFMQGMRLLREIQPATPVVVLMEDIDSIMDCYNESEVLNILDGVDQIGKAVFLATTNYPERLGARIINRPSRFDKRFKIGHPNAVSRGMYFEHILAGSKSGASAKSLGIDIDQWVKDTDGFSIAHLKELFVAVTILGDDYAKAIETLATMREFAPKSADDDEQKKSLGFGSSAKASRN